MSPINTHRKTVLITGASSGIGWELAACFAKDGYKILLAARDPGRLKTAASRLTELHQAECEIFPCDLSVPGSAKRLYETVHQQGLQIDALVNNAGTALPGPFNSHPFAQEQAVIQLNLLSPVELTALVLGEMRSRGEGEILNVASLAAFQPGPGLTIYAATKAFLTSFSEALNYELGKGRIQVSVLCPGITRTPLVAEAGKGSRLYRLISGDAPEVAAAGYKGLKNGQRLIIPGFMNKVVYHLGRLAPRWLNISVAAYINREALAADPHAPF